MAKKATESAPEEASLTDEDILSDLEGEMREIYKNGREFLEMGQESMAIKSFEILSTKAEKLGKENLVKFIESKIDNIY